MQNLTKTCRQCRETKPIGAFAKQHTAPGGHRSECRPCRATADREYLLGKRFGITPADYDSMLASQSGGCALCGVKTPGGRWARFHVDHDHATGRVRGLLCHGCNVALGQLGDSAEGLLRAYQYVSEPTPQEAS